jgi:signal transduction histidine kinase
MSSPGLTVAPTRNVSGYARLGNSTRRRSPRPARGAASIGRVGNGAVYEERVRLARELHDSVAQTLYGITLSASRVLVLLERRETTQQQAILEDLLQQANEGQKQLRAVLHELRSGDVDQLEGGLTGALRRLAADVQARAGYNVSLSLADEPNIAPSTKVALAMISREALCNTVKHARALRVDLALEVDPAYVTLRLADDGHGFDPAQPYPGHFGLHSMRERATAVGGTLDLISAPGRGTELRVRVSRYQR